MAVEVRIGGGSFDDFHIYIEETWDAVPREGETIVLDRGRGNTTI
jgi:hypothetical protein